MAPPEEAIQQALCPVLIGRTEELRILEAGLAAARQHRGRTFVLGGEAGIGKTRLASEVRDRAAKAQMTCLWGSCSQAELTLPYLPIVQAMNAYLAKADVDVVAQRLGSLVDGLSRLFPQLRAAAPTELGDDPADRKLRLFEAVAGLLSIAASPSGALLVIEDLHWADSATRELVEYLGRRSAALPVMVLITYRSDELHRRHPLQPLVEQWRRDADTAILQLPALGLGQVAAMVQAIFETSSVHDEFRNLLSGRSSGNPFVIEEMLKDAIDRGDIYRTAAGWERRPISEFRLPRRVRDAIIGRLEQLSPLYNDLLRVGAVLGRPADFDVLAKLLQQPDVAVQDALAGCVQQQLLVVEDGLYAFRHALTREVVYDDLVPPERKRLHLRIARILAKEPDADPVEQCNHLFGAGEWSAAVPLAMEAAEHCATLFAHAEAAALYERLLPHVTEPEKRAEILWLLAQRLHDTGEWARSGRYLESEIPALEQAGEVGKAARLRLALARTYSHTESLRLRSAEIERAIEVLEAEGPSGDLAEAYRLLAGIDLVEFRNTDGIRAAKRAVEIATEVGDADRLIEAYHYLGGNLYTAGMADEGLAYFDRAIQEAMALRRFSLAAEAMGNEIECLLWEFRFSQAAARIDQWKETIPGSLRPRGFRWRLGLLNWRLGALEASVASYMAAATSYRERGASRLAAEVELWLAAALADLGRFQECRSVLARVPGVTRQQRAVQAWARMRLDLDSGKLDGALSETAVASEASEFARRDRRFVTEIVVEVLLAAGKMAEARAVADLIDSQPVDPYQMRMEGRIALAIDDAERARVRLTAAAAFWKEAGGRLEEARTRRLLSHALQRLGDQESATEEMRNAYYGAVRCGAGAETHLAREALTGLGVHTEPTAEQVKSALELLHEPAAFGKSALMDTIGLSRDIEASRLGDVLAEVIRDLSNGPLSEASEAGRVLLDYYVNRVGSHEVVAERLHLSKRTFYRRLDRGLAILTERLSQLSMPTAI
ncbi:MAG TPA: AAA family ATPase [Candidatus Dormibacteraeota bacterium]|nr:AAA family ATPase [Candidatus Dormibacteraeota bacterium]